MLKYCISIARRRHPYIESLPTLIKARELKEAFFRYMYRQIEVGTFTILVLMQVVYTERRKLGTEYEIKAIDLHLINLAIYHV